MPLSKAKQAEYQRHRRRNLKLGMTKSKVIPNSDALSSNSSPLKDISNAVAPMLKCPNWHPMLDASGEVIPEYY